MPTDAEVLYPSSVPKETPPATSTVEQSPAVKAYWDTIAGQTRREQAARPDADVLYSNHGNREGNADAGKSTEAAPVADGEKTAETNKTADEQAAAKVLLFDGVADLKLPEGVMVSEKTLPKFEAFAKKHNFTKVDAQEAADMHMEVVGDFAQKLHQEATEMVQAWDKEVLNDKQIGGARYDETLDLAENVLLLADTKVPGFNGARFRADLVRTGMSNHPDMVRLMRYVSQNLNQRTAAPERPIADVLYPNHRKDGSK